MYSPDQVVFKGSQYWWLGDKRHRVDGSAIISADRSQYWFLNDKYYTDKKKFQKAANLSDEDMTILLLKYIWE